MNSILLIGLGVLIGYNGHDQIEQIVQDIKKDEPVKLPDNTGA